MGVNNPVQFSGAFLATDNSHFQQIEQTISHQLKALSARSDYPILFGLDKEEISSVIFPTTPFFIIAINNSNRARDISTLRKKLALIPQVCGIYILAPDNSGLSCALAIKKQLGKGGFWQAMSHLNNTPLLDKRVKADLIELLSTQKKIVQALFQNNHQLGLNNQEIISAFLRAIMHFQLKEQNSKNTLACFEQKTKDYLDIASAAYENELFSKQKNLLIFLTIFMILVTLALVGLGLNIANPLFVTGGLFLFFCYVVTLLVGFCFFAKFTSDFSVTKLGINCQELVNKLKGTLRSFEFTSPEVTLLQDAIKLNQLTIVKKLIDQDDPLLNQSIMTLSLAYNNLEAIKLLIEKKIGITIKEELMDNLPFILNNSNFFLQHESLFAPLFPKLKLSDLEEIHTALDLYDQDTTEKKQLVSLLRAEMKKRESIMTLDLPRANIGLFFKHNVLIPGKEPSVKLSFAND